MSGPGEQGGFGRPLPKGSEVRGSGQPLPHGSEYRGFSQPPPRGDMAHGDSAKPSFAPPCESGHTYALSQTGTFQCRTTTGRTPRTSHASRVPSRNAPPHVSETCLITLGSDSTARLPCADGLDDAAAPTPAEGNGAVGPSGAGPPGGIEVGPPATCDPKRGIEITQTPERAPPVGVPASASHAPVCWAPRHQRARTWFPHTREWSRSERVLSSSLPRHALRLISARFAFTRGHPPANSPPRPKIPNEDPPPPFAGQTRRSQSHRGERRRGPVGRGPVGQC